MGIAARAARDAGGEVEGYMLEALREREGAATAIGELHFVSTLEERKRAICAAAEAFVALPGGIGTLDELTEILTMDDIGLADKPVCLVDTDGFWDPVFAMLEAFDAYGVMRPGVRVNLCRASGALEALDMCEGALEQRRGRRAA